MNLVLSIIDVPYAAEQTKKPVKKPGRRRTVDKHKDSEPEFTTTYQVAMYLEKNYGLYSAFYKEFAERIRYEMKVALQNKIADLSLGAPLDVGLNTFDDLSETINQWFRDWISTGAAEHCGIPGTPTQAALNGVSHRLKKPFAKGNPRRPSFLDTGLMTASFRVVFE